MASDPDELVRAGTTMLAAWVEQHQLDSALLVSERATVIVVGGDGRRPSQRMVGQVREFLDRIEAENLLSDPAPGVHRHHTAAVTLPTKLALAIAAGLAAANSGGSARRLARSVMLGAVCAYPLSPQRLIESALGYSVLECESCRLQGPVAMQSDGTCVCGSHTWTVGS